MKWVKCIMKVNMTLPDLLEQSRKTTILMDRIQEGQAIIGLASNGIHSNGYSLVRKLIKESGIDLNDDFDGRTYLETFLAPTLYVKPILALKRLKLKE